MVFVKAARDVLLRPLQVVSGIVERRQTLPILANVLIEAEGEPGFQFRGGDGPKPTETEIAYISRAAPERIEREIAAYLEARGYKRQANTNPPPADQFASGSVYFVVVTKPHNEATKVWVTQAEF